MTAYTVSKALSRAVRETFSRGTKEHLGNVNDSADCLGANAEAELSLSPLE